MSDKDDTCEKKDTRLEKESHNTNIKSFNNKDQKILNELKDHKINMCSTGIQNEG